MSTGSFENLLSTLELWQKSDSQYERSLYAKFHSIYDIRQDSSTLVIPKSFESKVKGWMSHLGPAEALQALSCQTVISVRNKVLEVETAFNELRQKRPLPMNEHSEQACLAEIMDRQKENDCDFCQYKQFTAEDTVFGRVETKHAYTASNVFKIQAFNSMLIFRNHHPLNWSESEFLDAFCNTATQWFGRAHDSSPDHRYPSMSFDLLPNGGASQLHTHINMMLTKDSYPGGLYFQMKRMARYKFDGEESYFSVDEELHTALGLSARLGSAVALTSLTPVKANEVWVVSHDHNSNHIDFYRLLYCIIRVFIEDMKKFAFSMAIALPPFCSTNHSKSDEMPMIGRIVSRASLTSIASDVGSLDLFMAPSITSNPFATSEAIQRRVGQMSCAD